MILRTLYAIAKTWHYRKELKRYIIDSNLQVKNICSITPAYLSALNVHAVVLDYDGVLASHGEPAPRPEVVTWLRSFASAYAPHKIFILTNKPNATRMDYFKQNFPTITFVKARRKKPYPDGLQQIIDLCGCPGSQVLLFDDRLCTGILATLIAGVQGRWITKPYINFQARPFTEAGFVLLRWLERVAITYLVPKPLPS
ncbi:MAG TPA: HAD family hydrolase [Gammaproteobacteria bacterium]|nr:HAD family hydrolase [Gammaproteobacteria bacterium]